METQTPPTILLFLATFPAIYLLSYHTLFKRWPPKFRPEAASCAISFFHGTPAFLLSSFSLLHHRHNSSASSANTALQNTLLEFSLSYFITDLVNYLIFYPSDLVFVGHHLATLFVLSTCRYLVGHGAPAVLLLLAVAECTSALQNTWTLVAARRLEDARAAKVYGALRVPFYTVYSVARGVVGPVVVYRMWVMFHVGGGDGAIPGWLWGSWIVVVVMAIAGSLLWVGNLWAEFFRERSPMLTHNKHL